MKYHAMYKDSNDTRSKIINAEYEPNDDDCDFPSDEESEDEDKLTEDLKAKASIEEKKKAQGFVLPNISACPSVLAFSSISLVTQVLISRECPTSGLPS